MKKIFAIVLLMVIMLSLFTGCAKEMITVTEKKSTLWMLPMNINNHIVFIPRYGWDYKGKTADGKEVTWRGVENYEIGEMVEIVL